MLRKMSRSQELKAWQALLQERTGGIAITDRAMEKWRSQIFDGYFSYRLVKFLQTDPCFKPYPDSAMECPQNGICLFRFPLAVWRPFSGVVMLR